MYIYVCVLCFINHTLIVSWTSNQRESLTLASRHASLHTKAENKGPVQRHGHECSGANGESLDQKNDKNTKETCRMEHILLILMVTMNGYYMINDLIYIYTGWWFQKLWYLTYKTILRRKSSPSNLNMRQWIKTKICTFPNVPWPNTSWGSGNLASIKEVRIKRSKWLEPSDSDERAFSSQKCALNQFKVRTKLKKRNNPQREGNFQNGSEWHSFVLWRRKERS